MGAYVLMGSRQFTICIIHEVDCKGAKFTGNKQRNIFTHRQSALYISTHYKV